MATFEYKDEDGNTLLHLYLLEKGEITEGVHFFLENGVNVHIRNHLGQSAFHVAAGNSPSILEVSGLLVMYGAKVSDIDNRGSSLMHEILKNPFVTLGAIEKLLKLNAPANYRDESGKPPIAYVKSSSLEPVEKPRAEKMIIKHCVVKKIHQLEGQLDRFEDFIMCFNFFEDRRKIKEWSLFRDLCISEVLKMKNVRLCEENAIQMFEILTHIYDIDNHDFNEFEVKAILEVLQKNEYPCYRDDILSALENYNYE